MLSIVFRGFLSGLAFVCAGFGAFAQDQSTSHQDLAGLLGASPEGVIYTASTIITMDPDQPRAEAVAVVGDRILAVGPLEALQAAAGAQDFRVDDRFADKVLIAGFVEPHVHPVLTALTMTANVIAIEDWETLSGFSEAVRDAVGYRARLVSALAAHDGEDVFVTWGYHHYFHGEMSRDLLDQLAPDFPVVVWHRSAHEVYMNSLAMEQLGIDDVLLAGFTASAQEQSDLANGHLYEQGMLQALPQLAPALATPEKMRQGLEWSEDYYLRQGITNAAEPGGFYSKVLQDAVNAVYSDSATPFNHYFIPDGKTFLAAHPDDAEAMIAMTRDTLDWGEGRTRFLPQQVKLFTDGAIYSQLMQMRDGYTDGHEGEWIMDPEPFGTAFQRYWDAGYLISVHNNGDAGLDVLLDNLELAQRRKPRFDHRTIIVHFGFAADDQIERAARLGAIVSANPYYVTALAGRYKDVGIGPERSARMVPLGKVEDEGMSISFHSDMPMAPAQPLKLVWSAVNRLTAEGEVAGPDQVVSLETALKAITIDAAYAIRLEDEIGSITPGKMANFTVLESDPFDADPTDLKDLPVWGTVSEGRVQKAPDDGASKTGLPNPAAVFCIDSGGKYDIRDEADGQVGYCTLPDGTEVDAWEYFREKSASLAPKRPVDIDLMFARIARDLDGTHAAQLVATLAANVAGTIPVQ